MSVRTVAAILATLTLAGAANAANFCQAERLSCVTTMPVGGYCECTSKGVVEDGTVVAKLPPRQSVNATAGGCGANPRASGCR